MKPTRQFKTCDKCYTRIWLAAEVRWTSSSCSLQGQWGGLSGPAGVDWPEPLVKWVLEPAGLRCCHAQGSPNFTRYYGALGLLLISVVIRVSPPASRRTFHLVRLWRPSPLCIRHCHSFLPSRSRLSDNPRFQHRGAGCVCTRCVAPDHSFFRRPLCVTFFRSLPRHSAR